MDANSPTTDNGISRRQVVAGAGAALALAPLYAAYQATRIPRVVATPTAAVAELAPPRIAPPEFLEDLKQRTFRFFWETTNPRTAWRPTAGHRPRSRASRRWALR